MASENNKPEAGGATGKKKLPIALAVAGALLVGGVSGAFVAGPLMAKRTPAGEHSVQAADDEEHTDEEAEAEHEKESEEEADHGEEGKAAHPVHTVDNLVLNPAGSGGTRFLMLTIAMEVKNEAVATELGERDAEVRDAALRLLGAKTVEQLADTASREPLKEEVRTAVGALVGKKGAVRDVFFPQFVIQ